MSAVLRALESWFAEGYRTLGQVTFSEHGDGFVLQHADDSAGDLVSEFSGPDAALEIARYDDNGDYRPLRTAPNLRRGWKLEVVGWNGLRAALDGFYPAALGSMLAWREKRAEPVPLRETLGRQTGMYQFANTISDAGATEMVEGRCGSSGADGGCVRKVLWDLEEGKPLGGLAPEEKDPGAAPFGFSAGRIPIVCLEACNLLVAGARKVASAEFKAKGPSTDKSVG